MRVLALANNRVGLEVVRFLRRQGEELAGLVVHPPERRRYGEEIVAAAELPAERVFDGSRLGEAEVLTAIRRLAPEIGISAFFGYILKRPLLDLLPRGCLNLHPAFLPFNRGAYPNVWAIVDGTPAGVSLHYVDEGIDTGDLVARRRVEVAPVDTGATLYAKLERAALALFEETWPQIRAGRAERRPQPPDEGTFHRLRDVEAIDEIELDRTYSARRLIDVVRARTFPGHPGAYFRVDGRKVYLRLELAYGENDEADG